MGLGGILNRALGLVGVKLTRLPGADQPDAYDEDGLRSIHNHDFAAEAPFQRAYARGVQAASGDDYRWRWRVHVGLWAAHTAARTAGDFVECGTGHGFLSSAIMTHLDWNAQGRDFYLLNTFAGLDARFVSPAEKAAGHLEHSSEELASGRYASDVERVRANFAEWPRARIVAGAIPETLDQVEAEQIAYLHIDLNCSPPEVAALRHFWPRLAPGAVVLLDDYAYHGYHLQKGPMDALAAELGASILSLPTGQGLLLKGAADDAAG